MTLPPWTPPRTDIDDEVRFADHLFIMLDHDYLFPKSRKPFKASIKRGYPVDATDAGFIQDIRTPTSEVLIRR